jgi:hypothetical protein
MFLEEQLRNPRPGWRNVDESLLPGLLWQIPLKMGRNVPYQNPNITLIYA